MLVVEAVQMSIGRQFGIEDEFLRNVACALFPEVDKLQDGIGLFFLADIGLSKAEDTGIDIVGQERQQAFLLAGAFGDVMFLDKGIVTMERDGVEVKIKGVAARQAGLAEGVEPAAQQGRITGWVEATTVFGQ